MRDAKAFKDHYATLGVSPDATRKEIRTARNRLLRQHHPDLAGSDAKSKEKTVDILLAGKVLLDDDARREYDRTYRYVYGRARAATPPTSARAETPERGVPCSRCGRRNSWERTYCIYCGAGIEGTSSDSGIDDILSQDLRKGDPAGASVHFGCGALLGLVVFGLFGFRTFAVSGSDSSFPIVVLVGIGVLAFGTLAARLRDKFWTTLVQFSLLLPLLVLYVLLALMMGYDPGRHEGIVLIALAIGFLVLAAWSLVGDRRRDVVPKRRRRRRK